MAARLFASATELAPVDLLHFPAGRPPRVDLYQHVDGRWVLYCEAHTTFTNAARLRLISSNVKRLYIRFADGSVVASGNSLSTLLSLPDDELAPAVKATLMYSSAMSTAKLIFLTPGIPKHIDVALGVVCAIAGEIVRSPRCISGLVQTMRNDTVYAHSVNVCIYATALAHYGGDEGNALSALGMGAFLHDIGKARVPRRILDKPSTLSGDEWEIMMKHPEMGLEVLGDQAQRLAPEVNAAVLEHHERLDGSGYPRGLRGEEISRAARLVAMADVYDALTSQRPYRSALSPFAALRTVRDEMLGQMDRGVFDNFVRMLGEPAGRAAQGRRLSAPAPTTARSA
jgi:putative nucleotidyltransferase with HDIG domain